MIDNVRRQSRQCSLGSETEGMCAVCLDTFEEGAAVTKLACHHSFHSRCIHPWLNQQGLSALCPLCKAEVWPKDSGCQGKEARHVELPDVAALAV